MAPELEPCLLCSLHLSLWDFEQLAFPFFFLISSTLAKRIELTYSSFGVKNKCPTR
jgi:hypothetical protein